MILRKFFKILKRSLLVLVLLVLLLYGLLHVPAVQTWLVKKVTANLSQKLHTKVTIKKIDFAFFNKLLLEGLLVEDQKKDTLLYAGTAKVSITDWFFLKDKITLKYVGLDNAVVNLNRTDSVWNYQFLVDYFSGPKKTNSTQKKGIEFNLSELHFNNIRFNQIDKWFGKDIKGALKKLDLLMEPVDYDKKQIVVNQLFIDEPLFYQADYTGNEPPEVNTLPQIKKLLQSTPFKWNNSGWTLQLKKMQLQGGSFMTEKETLRQPYVDRFDGQHLFFSSINGSINNVLLQNDTLTADVLLTTQEKSGLLVKKLQAAMKFTPEIMEFNNLDLITNKSHLRNYYSMRYNSFRTDMNNFMHSVELEGHFKDSELNSDDLAFFAPELSSWKRIFYLQGNAKGTIDNFSAKNIKIKSGNSSVDGDIALRGLPDIKTTFIDFKANNLQTSYNDLVAIIPPLKNVTQPHLSKLGNIYYRGSFTGFLNDFVTYGTIQSNLGTIAADVNMKIPENGVSSYSGNLLTVGFRLGEFIDNAQLGKISLNGKIAGSGFTLDNLNANFKGAIRQVEFGGYNYQNIILNGDFKKKLFNGHLTMDDPNLKINNLNGSLSLYDKEIAFNLDADLQYANLKNIHLTNDDLSLSGLLSLNFTGNNIDNFLGTAKVYKARLQHDTTLFSFDSLTLSSLIKEDKKYLTLQSNDLEAEVRGKFSILELPDAFRVFLSRYYPTYIKAPSYKLSDQDFSFSIKTKEVDQYVRLFDNRLRGFNYSDISGKLNLANNELNITADIPQFTYDDKTFTGIKLQGNGNRDTLKTDIAVADIGLSDSLHFPETKLQISANNDVSVIHLRTSASKTLNDAELNASIKTLPDGVKIHFFPSSFIINDKRWLLEKDGELTIKDNYLDANDVKFVQGKQHISLSTELDDVTGTSHIIAKMEQVNLGDFLPFAFTKPDIKGLLTGTAIVRNPFGKIVFDFTGFADSLIMDGKYIGKTNLSGSANTNTGLVKFKADANEGDFVFNIDGSYNYKDSSENQMDINLLAGKLNLNILEPYLGTVFSRIDGIAQSNLKITGGGDNKYVTGDVFIEDGSVKVAYTQCRYLLSKQKISFKKDEIDLGIINLKDTLGNTGVAAGKMYHHFFDRFSFDNVRFETEKLVLLHTTKKDNSQFYGNVIGSATMTLNGPVTNLVMNIDGQPSSFDSSHIYLPTGAGKESNVVDYIEFIQFGSKMEDDYKGKESTNIVVNMNLRATPACKIDVILDEETGDVIKGQGDGILTIRAGNKEPFTIRGRYDLTKGEYTFNFQTFLKRPFTLNHGSIVWNGDPYQAIINIEAEYLAKNVDISSLKTTTGGFRQKEDVTIISHITGSLQKPVIDFEFKFDSRSDINRDDIAVKKLADFKNDPNEMYKQVASLLLFNSFISADQNFISGEKTVALAGSTIGGVISGWLTNLFNKQLQRATNGVLSTYIDIDPTISLQKNASQLQANVRAGLKILLSKRLNILIGGNLDYNSPYAQLDKKGLLTPDITVEWLLNKDGSLRVVGFNRTSVDLTTGQRNRSGLQLSYRKDVDKLSDIFRSKKKIESRNKKTKAVSP